MYINLVDEGIVCEDFFLRSVQLFGICILEVINYSWSDVLRLSILCCLRYVIFRGCWRDCKVVNKHACFINNISYR